MKRALLGLVVILSLSACNQSGYFDENGIWVDGTDQNIERAVQDAGNQAINGQKGNPFKNHPRYREFKIEVDMRCQMRHPNNESRYQSCLIRDDNAMNFEAFIKYNQEPFRN